jgi:hypothetical protein
MKKRYSFKVLRLKDYTLNQTYELLNAPPSLLILLESFARENTSAIVPLLLFKVTSDMFFGPRYVIIIFQNKSKLYLEQLKRVEEEVYQNSSRLVRPTSSFLELAPVLSLHGL